MRRYLYHCIIPNYSCAGPAVRISPTEAVFFDATAKKQIYTVKEKFLKSRWYQDLTGPTITSVFNTRDIATHRRLRRLLSGPLSESSLRNVEPIVRERVDLTIQRVGEEVKTRGAADIAKWSLFMSTDVIGELTFGQSFRMLEKGEVRLTHLEIYARTICLLNHISERPVHNRP